MQPDHSNCSRRRFHVRAINGLMGLVSAALGLPALAYLLVPGKGKKVEEWIEAGEMAKLGSNGAEEFVFRRMRKDGWKVMSQKTSAWITKQDNGELVAFAPGCTHLGCAYHWDEKNKNFLCPCHTSTFGKDGAVLTGPAPRPLDRYVTKIENGKLMLGPVRESEG